MQNLSGHEALVRDWLDGEDQILHEDTFRTLAESGEALRACLGPQHDLVREYDSALPGLRSVVPRDSINRVEQYLRWIESGSDQAIQWLRDECRVLAAGARSGALRQSRVFEISGVIEDRLEGVFCEPSQIPTLVALTTEPHLDPTFPSLFEWLDDLLQRSWRRAQESNG